MLIKVLLRLELKGGKKIAHLSSSIHACVQVPTFIISFNELPVRALEKKNILLGSLSNVFLSISFFTLDSLLDSFLQTQTYFLYDLNE